MKTRKINRSQGKLNEIAVKLAKLRYEDNLSPKEIATICEQEGLDISDRTVRRLLSRALDEKQPLVKLRVVATDYHVQIHDTLGKKLEKKYELEEAVVVKTSLCGTIPNAAHGTNEWDQYQKDSDELHEILGLAAARRLTNFLRKGDIVGVSGGRGVGNTVCALEHLKPFGLLPPINLAEVWSLAGNAAISNSYIENRKTLNPLIVLDANAIAMRLASLFEFQGRVVKVRRVDLPLFCEEIGDEIRNKLAPHLMKSGAELNPTISLFGLGLCNTENSTINRSQYKESINNKLGQLINICNKNKWVLAEVCYNFFLASTSDSQNSDWDKAKTLLSALQSKTICVSFARLKQSTKILVAGGSDKLVAIRALLSHNGCKEFKPSFFITDQSVAGALINSDK